MTDLLHNAEKFTPDDGRMTYCLDLVRAVVYAGTPEYAEIVMFNPTANPAANFAAIAALTVCCLAAGTFLYARSEKNR